jgi:hypothetical protein
MPWMLEETNESLTKGVLIWDVEALSKNKKSLVKKYFEELAEKVKKALD